MIPEIAWENVRWINENIFDRWEHFGGKMIAVDPFRSFFRRSWIKRLRPKTAARRFHEEIRRWANVACSEPLFEPVYFRDKPEPVRHVHRMDGDFPGLFWLIIRSYYNLYCLATHRKTIEELALGAYAYSSKTEKHTEMFDKAALADFRRLLRLSNAFLLAQWVHDMIERAIANRDEAFFRIISNSVKRDIMADASPAAVQWLLVVLLWFLGGKDIRPRREFLHLLIQEGILPKEMCIDEDEFRSQLASFGLTKA